MPLLVTSRGPNAIALACTSHTHSVDLWWVNMRAYDIFASQPKFTKFFPFTVVRIVVDHLLFRLLVPRSVPETFKVYSCPTFCTFVAVANFPGAGLQKLYPHFYFCLPPHHVDKFGEVIPTGPKVISQKALNFGPIFEFPSLKNCWGTLSTMSCTLASLGYCAVLYYV